MRFFFFFWLEVMDKNWRHDRTALDIDKNQLMRESELEAPRATAAAVFSIEKLLANTTGIIIYYNKKKKEKEEKKGSRRRCALANKFFVFSVILARVRRRRNRRRRKRRRRRRRRIMSRKGRRRKRCSSAQQRGALAAIFMDSVCVERRRTMGGSLQSERAKASDVPRAACALRGGSGAHSNAPAMNDDPTSSSRIHRIYTKRRRRRRFLLFPPLFFFCCFFPFLIRFFLSNENLWPLW